MKDENTHDKMCEWNVADGGCPLDYPFKTVSDKWRSEIPKESRRIDIRRDLLTYFAKNSPIFESIFKPIFNHDPESHKIETTPPPLRVQVEFEPFFRDFILSYCQCNLADRQNASAKNLLLFSEDFGRNFIKNTRNSIQGNIEAPIEGRFQELDYYEKMLYTHPAFQKLAAKYSWEAEFDRRCRLLKETVLKCSPDQRLREMPDILKFLDSKIGFYSVIAKRSQDQKEESLQDFLEDFPEELMRFRNRNENGYFFKDISVKIDENSDTTYLLSDLFSQYCKEVSQKNKLSPDKRDQLLAASRKQYLQFLSQDVDECYAYTQAHALDIYLFDPYLEYNRKRNKDDEAVEIEIDLNTIREKIHAVALSCYFPYFKNQHSPLFNPSERFPFEYNVTTAFLDGILASMANAFAQNNRADMMDCVGINESLVAEFLTSSVVKQVHNSPMESPELFPRFYRKYVGHKLPFDEDTTSQYTFIEWTIFFYYYILSAFELPHMKNPDNVDIRLQAMDWHTIHPAHDALLYFVLSEWNALLLLDHTALEQYCNDPGAPFPRNCNDLHSMLFTIRLYYDFRAAINTAEECYIQYKEAEYHEKGISLVWKNKEKPE